jgi:hypothetical protein
MRDNIRILKGLWQVILPFFFEKSPFLAKNQER